MADDLTPKQDAFALAYIETGNASEAYRRAYDAENMKPETVHVEACVLLKNPKVAIRVIALQEEHRVRHRITVDGLTEELEEARQLATRIEQPAAMVSATLGKAKLHGIASDPPVTVNLVQPLSDADRQLLSDFAKAD